MLFWILGLASVTAADPRERVEVTSTLDGTPQPSYLIPPPAGAAEPYPLLVSLHTWSGDLEQRNPALEKLAAERGWMMLYPNFRGANTKPEACGSELAQQDILDAVAWVRERYPIDATRIYLTGVSGGGHLTMLMAGRHPGVWAAASAWVGISDLAAWHEKHAGGGYGNHMEASCGGKPGDSEQVDTEYRNRSPLTWLQNAVDLPLDLGAGIHDGHTGSVPIFHTLRAFNAVATAQGEPPVTATEIAELATPDGRLANPQPQDTAPDETFGRAIYLRRTAGKCRVTIFEGGHEGLATATVAWLERWRKE